jgi:hypothetical protein
MNIGNISAIEDNNVVNYLSVCMGAAIDTFRVMEDEEFASYMEGFHKAPIYGKILYISSQQ